ncbi:MULTISPECIES: DNA adenine methylase [unclassified Anabaena]|uniref:DNA adenine methylase n=1 Tax=unclassified Anabaena TaxID=2619674 RepID=UPI000832C3E5|nr:MULTISPECIES: DNA adenine methylase [unclassified Anabaena]
MLSKVPTLPVKSTLPKPFLKWAGGKSQLIEQMSNFFPKELQEGAITRYIEPFIGGGAVFFYIAHKYQISELFISDINTELIIAYKTIKNNVDDLIELLSDIESMYLSFDEVERNNYFYQIRNRFNQQKKYINLDDYNSAWLERTAHIIFLNKTCYNGLYRVNSNGHFNVPIGKYKKPLICDKRNLKAVAKILARTQILNGDFSDCEKFVDNQTFVYFDPPYRPLNDTSSFTAYSQQTFDDTQQLRLRDFFQSLDKKGASLLLSNSDPKNTNINDNFFETAYKGYRIEKVRAKRNINSNPLKRQAINELLILNY